MEKIHAWRWTTLSTSSHGGERCEDVDDDVMQVEGGSTVKPSGSTYRIREFFVKWLNKSHWKNSWVSEIRVSG